MIDISNWEEEVNEDNVKAQRTIIEAVRKGSSPSLLELSPRFKDIIQGHTYGLWNPPQIPNELQNPARRILTSLVSDFSPEVLLVPLYYNIRNKKDFIETYGLSKEYGISYDNFLDLVKNGRIHVYIQSSPSTYESSFYNEIFKNCYECDNGSYLPPQFPLVFYTAAKFGSLIKESGPNLDRETLSQILKGEKHHPDYWIKIAENSLAFAGTSITDTERNDYINGVANDSWCLYASGFSGLADLLSEKLIRNPDLLQKVLRYYRIYLANGYSDALGGLRFYDGYDIERMSFLRLIPNEKYKELQELIKYSPAASTIAVDPIDSLLISEPGEGDIERALQRDRDEELMSANYDIQNAIQNYDFVGLMERSKKINEIITEQLNRETKEHFRNSKLIRYGVRLAGSLGVEGALMAATGGASASLPGLGTLIGNTIDEVFLGKQVNRIGQYLSKKWIFRQKGLPSIIWEISQDENK